MTISDSVCSLAGVFLLSLVVACNQDRNASRKDAGGAVPTTTTPSSSVVPTTMPPADARAVPSLKDFCSLPGSVVFDESGRHVVGGGASQLPWLTLPKGFCAHHFAKLPSVREIRFGPGGELFASSSGRPCAGGAAAGLGAIVMIPDDDGDGVGDNPIQMLSGLDAAHGFAF